MTVIAPLLAFFHFVRFETKILNIFSWKRNVKFPRRKRKYLSVRIHMSVLLVQVSIKNQNEQIPSQHVIYEQRIPFPVRVRTTHVNEI